MQNFSSCLCLSHAQKLDSLGSGFLWVEERKDLNEHVNFDPFSTRHTKRLKSFPKSIQAKVFLFVQTLQAYGLGPF